MSRPKVLILHSKIPEKAFKMLADKGYNLTISRKTEGFRYPLRETLLEEVRGVDAIMWFGHTKVDQEMIEAAGSNLKVVGSMGAGYDHINVGLLYEENIKVSNTPNILGSAVADLAIALALAVSRNLINAVKVAKEGNWGDGPVWMCGATFEEATVGVVGLGDIGSKIVQRVNAFDVKEVLYYNRSKKTEDQEKGAKYTSLDDLLRRSDFVFLSVPSNKDTKHLLRKESFEKMKKSAILINSARGDVVNQDDLIAALKEGKIGGAGLDVTVPEPLPTDSELFKMDNVVVTPHISSATLLAREKMAVMAAQNIINCLEGKELISPIPRPKD